jgi:maltose O-acetyltransferase
MNKLERVLREELGGLHLRLALARILLLPLPLHVGSRLRSAALRQVGFAIGHGTVMWGLPQITGGENLYEMLRIGEYCWVNAGCFFDLGSHITIGDRVAIGHQVMLLTTSHEQGGATRRAGEIYTAPISIGQGAWLGSRATVLPGVRIGSGAVVGAGALVTRDVPDDTLVAGVPAKPIRALDYERPLTSEEDPGAGSYGQDAQPVSQSCA